MGSQLAFFFIGEAFGVFRVFGFQNGRMAKSCGSMVTSCPEDTVILGIGKAILDITVEVKEVGDHRNGSPICLCFLMLIGFSGHSEEIQLGEG